MLRSLYLSPLGIVIHYVLKAFSLFQKPFMVYGYRDSVSGGFRKRTRISSSAVLGDRERISMGDGVWIWHHTIVDASNGVTIGEGAQIGAWVGIFTHGSQLAVRLHGRRYIDVSRDDRIGYTRGEVVIGPYCFIGAGALIMPGVTLGKGCLVAAASIVTKTAPDFAILRGNPAEVVGDVRTLDRKYFRNLTVQQDYFDRDTIGSFLNKYSPDLSATVEPE